MTIVPNSAGNSCLQTGLCRMRTESLAAPSPRSGKRFSDARDRRPRTASEAVLLPCRDCKPALRPRKTAGYSSNHGKSRLAWECVVGPGGLEPAARRLSAPAGKFRIRRRDHRSAHDPHRGDHSGLMPDPRSPPGSGRADFFGQGQQPSSCFRALAVPSSPACLRSEAPRGGAQQYPSYRFGLPITSAAKMSASPRASRRIPGSPLTVLCARFLGHCRTARCRF